MKRKNFLRAMGLLAVSPGILTKLRPVKKPAAALPIFKEMPFMEPKWTPELFDKWADKNFIEIMKEMGAYKEVKF